MSIYQSPFQIDIMPKKIYAVVLGIISVLIVHFYLLSSEGFIYNDLRLSGIFFVMALGILLAIIIHYMSLLLDKVMPWQSNVAGRLALEMLTLSLSSFIILYGFYSYRWKTLTYEMLDQVFFGKITCIKLAIIVTVISVIISIISYAVYSYQTFAITQINQTKLKRELFDIQLVTLKSQLRPHFLFNSLNTISSLIHANTSLAEDFIRKLAHNYNYTLTNYNKASITLQEELNLVQSYTDMMKIRFGAGINISIEIADTIKSTDILPLSIQSLVENAIKHNTIGEEDPLSIDITYEDSFIKVKNNKTSTPSNVASNKIGLTNLKKRYFLWNGRNVDIEDTDYSFFVKVPIA